MARTRSEYSDATRLALVESAMGLFAAGVHRHSLDEVAAKPGDTGAITTFRSKRLVEAVCDYGWSKALPR